MFLSRFSSVQSLMAQPAGGSWEDLIQFLQFQEHNGPKNSLPAFSPAEFRGNVRRSSHVERVHFVVLDLDRVTTEVVDGLIDRLDQRLDAILYTTWSHPLEHKTTGRWGLRVVINLSRPVEPNEWDLFWDRLVDRLNLGGLADPKCKDPGRLYFMPAYSGAGGRTGTGQFQFSGQPLDVDDFQVTGNLPEVQT